jgi:hypothetical protein
MPRKELKVVLMREIRDQAGVEEPFIFDFKVEQEENKGQVGFSVAVFYARTRELLELLSRLKKLGVEPAKIIPQMDCFYSLISSEETDAGTAFFEVSGNMVNLNICQKKKWLYKREFTFSRAKDDQTNEACLERISIELTRTFQYFKQKNRSIKLSKLVIYGTNRNLLMIGNFLKDNFSLKVERMAEVNFSESVKFSGNLENVSEFISYFAGSIGISQSIADKKELDLFPLEFREKETMPRRLLGLGISAGILLVIMGFASFYLEGIKNRYREQILKKDKFFNMVDFKEVERYRGFISKLSKDRQIRANKVLGQSNNPVEFINLTRKIREGFYQREYFINFPLQFSFTAANFLRKLSVVISGKIHLSSLTIKLDKSNLDFSLNGVISEEKKLLEKFLDFYKKVENFNNILEVNFSKIQVDLNQSRFGKNKSNLTKSGVKKRQQLFFSIRGTLELE